MSRENAPDRTLAYVGKTTLLCAHCRHVHRLSTTIPAIVAIVMKNSGWVDRGGKQLCPRCALGDRELDAAEVKVYFGFAPPDDGNRYFIRSGKFVIERPDTFVPQPDTCIGAAT